MKQEQNADIIVFQAMMRLLSRIPFWGALALAVTPLVFFSGSLFPFTFFRGTVAQIIIELVFLAAVVVWIAEPRFRPRLSHPLVLLFLAFIVAAAVSTIFGANIHQSLWSDMARSLGQVYWVHLGLLVTVLVSPLLDHKDWRAFTLVAYGASVVVAIIALLQLRFPGFYAALEFGTETNVRVVGSLGNPIFFTMYLVPFIFLSGYFFSIAKRPWLRVIPALIALIELAALYFSQTRGGYVAVAGGFLACIMAYLWTSWWRAGRVIAVGVVALAVFFGAVLIVGWGSTWLAASPAGPLVRVLETRGITVSTRLINWGVAAKGIAARPIFGWGPENFRFISDEFFNPQLVSFSFYEVRADKPHNMWLEILATTGIVGAGFYLGFFLMALLLLLRGVRRGDRGQIPRATAIALVGAFAAWATHDLTAFDIHVTLLTVVFLLVWVVRLTPDTAFAPARPLFSIIANFFNKFVSRLRVPIVGIVFIATLIVMWSYNIQPLRAAYFTNTGLKLAGSGAYDEASPYFHRGAALPSPYHFESWRWFGHALTDQGNRFRSEQHLTPAAVSALRADIPFLVLETEKIRAEFSRDPMILSFVSRMYYQLAVLTEDNTYLDRAEAVMHDVLSMAPNRDEARFILGQIYLVKHEYAKAVVIFRQAIARAPRAAIAHWLLGFAEWEGGKRQVGAEEIVKAWDLGFREFEKDDKVNLTANAFLELKDDARLVALYEYLTAAQPERAEWYARLAATYVRVKRYEEARAAVAEAVRRDPSFAEEAEAFLKTLPNYH